MKFDTKQEQYEWWTEVIGHIQSNKVSIREGCRELGIAFWQYYEWKERVQEFVDKGEVNLSEDEANGRPKGRPKSAIRHSKSKTTQVQASFIEVVPSAPLPSQGLSLYFRDSWRLEITENFNPSILTEVIKTLETL